MTERESLTPEQELADIAASVRRYVERESAAGGGDLLARGVRAVRAGSSPAAAPAEAPPATPSRSRATPEPTAPPRPAPVPPKLQPAKPKLEPAPRASDATSPWRASEPAVPPASATPISLFGDPEAAPATPVPAMSYALDLPPVHPPLNPIELDARATVQVEALPILDTIAAEARACRKCGLCETRRNAVPGVGSATGGIVFVGEAPGADEDAQGEPFVGRAGQLLTQIIKAMDDKQLIPGVKLDRSTVYICNVLKCRPPENRNPLPHEIEACSPYLRRQLDVLQPRIICCLGKFAAELLVGVKGTIAGLRGKVYRYQGAKLIVTYHPAACLRNPGYKRPVWEDMQLLAREYLEQGVR